MRLRQIKEFLFAVTETCSENTSGPKSQKRMYNLKAYAFGIVPGVNEGPQSLKPVISGPDQPQDKWSGKNNAQRKLCEFDTAYK